MAECNAVGCYSTVRPDELMCGRHWRLVPKALQGAVWAGYRAMKKGNRRRWVDAANNAITAVAKAEGKEVGSGG